MKKRRTATTEGTLDDFIRGKSALAVSLLDHFAEQFKSIGDVELLPAKTMIGVATPRKRVAYVTQLGKDFIHVVFPFEKPFTNNLCFQKIAQVPGDAKQFNHHFRMFRKEDVNKEVLGFMKLAYELGK
jgi:hypothetical protein